MVAIVRIVRLCEAENCRETIIKNEVNKKQVQNKPMRSTPALTNERTRKMSLVESRMSGVSRVSVKG